MKYKFLVGTALILIWANHANAEPLSGSAKLPILQASECPPNTYPNYGGERGQLPLYKVIHCETVTSPTTACPFTTSFSDGCVGAETTGFRPYPHLADVQTVLDLSLVPGSGGTSGTYNLSATGCSGSGFAGTVTVSGGEYSSYIISNPGSGYTCVPTIVVSGSPGVSGGSITPMVLQKSPHNTTTTFSLPGTDYDVSYNQSLSLVTPTSGNLPACASLSGGIVTVNSAPCEITGFSFPTSIVLYVSSGLGTSNQVKIDNNKFQVLSTNVAAIRLNGGACNVLIENNEFTDNATAGGSGVVSEDIFNECASGTVSVEYNYCHDVWQKCEDQNSNTGGTLTFNWEYNLNVDISLGLTDNGHGETTYAFASVGNTHHQIDIVTDEFNVYYSPWDTSVQSTTNASQTALDAALQADGIELENSITAHNLILAPGPYSVTGSNNSGANGITGSANEFPGVQDSGSISGTMTSTDNYMYYPGVYFPYNTTTVTGYTFSDINAGTGNSCNPTTCN